MLHRLLPREETFFDLFKDAALNLLAAAKELKALVDDFREIDKKAAAIKTLEDKGDEITHTIIERLNRSFIVPFDREDIFGLAKALDDVVDWIEAASARMVTYKVPESTPETRQFADIIVDECKAIAEAIGHLRTLDRLSAPLMEINRLENMADQVQREAIGRLFADAANPIDVIKWKEIYETLEEATDQGEHVAHLLEGIHAKHM
jgi:predicted phosphate transport protein (TIGR00153 family)